MTAPTRRSRSAIVVALCAAVLLGSCSPRGDWQEIVIDEGGFAVLMRGQPRYARQQVETPAGKMYGHLYSSDRPDAFFAVGYSDYPIAHVLNTPPRDLLEGVRDTWAKRMNGRLVMSSASQLKGAQAGLEFSAEGRVKEADTFLQGRLYLVDQRLYQVIAMGRKGEVAQGTLNRFLNSFRIVPGGTSSTIQVVPPTDK